MGKRPNNEWAWAYGAGLFGGTLALGILLLVVTDADFQAFWNNIQWTSTSDKHGVLQTASYVIGPIVAVVGIYLLNKRTRATEEQVKISYGTNIIQTHQKAIDFLGSENAIQRFAAAQLLLDVAKSSSDNEVAEAICSLFCGFITERSKSKITKLQDSDLFKNSANWTPKMDSETHAAFLALNEISNRFGIRVQMNDAYISGAFFDMKFDGYQFNNCIFANANFGSCIFERCFFSSAMLNSYMFDTDLKNAILGLVQYIPSTKLNLQLRLDGCRLQEVDVFDQNTEILLNNCEQISVRNHQI